MTNRLRPSKRRESTPQSKLSFSNSVVVVKYDNEKRQNSSISSKNYFTNV